MKWRVYDQNHALALSSDRFADVQAYADRIHGRGRPQYSIELIGHPSDTGAAIRRKKVRT